MDIQLDTERKNKTLNVRLGELTNDLVELAAKHTDTDSVSEWARDALRKQALTDLDLQGE